MAELYVKHSPVGYLCAESNLAKDHASFTDRSITKAKPDLF